MTALSLSGKELAATIRADVSVLAAQLTEAGSRPTLTVVVATDDESSAWYVRSIAKSAEKVGITCQIVDLGAEASTAALTTTLAELSADSHTHGIILQTPLPKGNAVRDLAASIIPAKDVDGANPLSLGRLATGLPAFAPATAEAVVTILEHHHVDVAGQHVVVVGRSTVVGKPAAHLLLDRDATVTVAHSRTRDLASITRQADVLVVAVGRAEMITADYVRPGAVVIDVGTNPTDDGGLVGDVHADSVAQVASGLTPVPGGVGPVTTALLLKHTVQAASPGQPIQ